MIVLKALAILVEIAVVIGVVGYFIVEGFSGTPVLNVVLFLLAASSLGILVGAFRELRK